MARNGIISPVARREITRATYLAVSLSAFMTTWRKLDLARFAETTPYHVTVDLIGAKSESSSYETARAIATTIVIANSMCRMCSVSLPAQTHLCYHF